MSVIEGPFSAMPKHKPGCVVVAVSSKRTVALLGGPQLTWGERTFGGYNTFYNVSVATQLVSFSFKAPSNQSAIEFDVVAELAAKIVDPAAAVTRDISDLDALFSASVRRVARALSEKHSITDLPKARSEIEQALRTLEGDAAVAVVDATVELNPDAAAQALLRSVAEEELVVSAGAARGRIEAARRTEIVALLDNPDALLAQSIVTKDPTFKEALNFKLQQLSENREQQYNILKMMIENNVIEPHDIHSQYDELVKSIISSLRPYSKVTSIDDNTKSIEKK
jgi:hypothetical protein